MVTLKRLSKSANSGVLTRTGFGERPTIIKFYPPPVETRAASRLPASGNARYLASYVGALSVLMASCSWCKMYDGLGETEIAAKEEYENRGRSRSERECANARLYLYIASLFPSDIVEDTLWWFLAARGGIGDRVPTVKPNPRESCATSSSLERKKRLDDG